MDNDVKDEFAVIKKGFNVLEHNKTDINNPSQTKPQNIILCVTFP